MADAIPGTTPHHPTSPDPAGEPGTGAERWEAYWKSVPPARTGDTPGTGGDADPGEGVVLWDTPAVLAPGAPLLFAGTGGGADHPDLPDLPVVDVGCGNGTRTRALAARFSRVIGIDVSTTAVELARRAAEEDPGPTPEFRRADAADPDTVRALHAELGDCHVYLRGVLHQAPPGVREALAAGVATLVGSRGRALVVEPAAAAEPVLRSLMERPQGPPASLAAVFAAGLTPADLPDAEIPRLLREAGLEVLESEPVPLGTTARRPDGGPVELPAHRLLLGRAPAPSH
ncbi:class I SAM-dependent methyltransferase [Streptomyces sp. ST2-7A]|uniref:class I SAM-dependent methyltransferase n=1 Tax=Streptomyces sp. ST2-7A TaxID=2907214 RepID=UPI001F2A385A|nr:class I SAM-dependent methyltransferase [Streptomyces sp. ST2-7A]MCE7081635.1 class I SAM-dependent methyltransferase [Streptomyces sp. ST2-7A]